MGWDSFPIPNSLGNAWKFHLTPGPLCALKQSPVWSDCSPVGRQAAASSRVIDWINSLIPNRWIEYWCLVSPHHRRKTQSASTAPKFNPLLSLLSPPWGWMQGPALSAGDPTSLNEKRYINLWDTLPNHWHAMRSHSIFCKKPSFHLFHTDLYQGPLLLFLLSFPTSHQREYCMLHSKLLKIH